jgi:gluconate 2-dehydrogenase gamma chain
MWLDGWCTDRYGNAYLTSAAAQQKETLDLIAYRKNTEKDASLGQGVEFFAFLRKLTTDGFYSSEIGIKDLQYIGNTFLRDFPGCPPVPET